MVVSEVGVVGIDKYGDGGSFEKVIPVAQSAYDG